MSQASQPSGNSFRLLGWGVASVGMYLLLFLFEQPILQWSSRGGWYFVFPVLIAFAFSFVHGNFTGEFWNSLGIRARQ